jgi:hypothetical protein
LIDQADILRKISAFGFQFFMRSLFQAQLKALSSKLARHALG